MSTFLKAMAALGAVGVVALVAIGWFFFLDFKGAASDADGVAQQAVRAAMANWNEAAITASAIPDFIGERADGKFDPRLYRRIFGPVAAAKPCFATTMAIANSDGSGEWHCPVKFEWVEGKLIVGLTRSGGTWRGYSLAVQI